MTSQTDASISPCDFMKVFPIDHEPFLRTSSGIPAAGTIPVESRNHLGARKTGTQTPEAPASDD
jgi:hypothetical protein